MDPSMIDPSIAAAILSTVGAWAWDAVGKSAAARLRGKASEQAEAFGWKEAAKTYAEELARQHSTMRVLGKPDPVRLDDVFTDVYILSGASGSRRFPIHELRQREFDRFERYLDRSRQDRMAGLDLVKQGRNLFILGKPGAGKTTFLRHVVLETLRGQIEHTPIFISLKRWSTSNHDMLLPYLVEQFAICGFPDAGEFLEQLLASGKAIVLFDGLDEVNHEDDQRRTLVRLLQDFADQYNRSQVLITCRIAASDYMFAKFSDVEVTDFERDQIHAYASKWFCGSENGNEEAEATRRAFIKDLYSDENQGIRELCSSPLLLAMLCLAYGETGYFPKRRAELYEDATEALLRKWDATRNIRRDEIYQELSHRRRQQLLSHIAMRTFEAGEYFIERRVLEKQIDDYLRPLAQNQDLDANAVLRAIAAQHGFLVERARDIYSFSHLTFQEYFAARYVVDNEARGAARRLARNHLNDSRWSEVYMLTASLLYEADDFFTTMRETVNHLISDDDDLIKLLRWTTRRACKVYEENVPAERQDTIHFAYISLALALDLDRARERAFARERVPCLEFFRDHAIELALARVFDLTRVLDFDFAKDCARELARAYGFRMGADFALTYAWQIAAIFDAVRNWDVIAEQTEHYPAYFEHVIRMVEQASDAFTAQQLHDLVLPSSDQGSDDWSSFANSLRTAMREGRDIGHDWHFSNGQWFKLNAYFTGNKLLIDCLDLAYVSDRQAILNGLLAPPA